MAVPLADVPAGPGLGPCPAGWVHPAVSPPGPVSSGIYVSLVSGSSSAGPLGDLGLHEPVALSRFNTPGRPLQVHVLSMWEYLYEYWFG